MKHWRTIWIITANTALLYCLLQVAAYLGLQAYDAVAGYLLHQRSSAELANYSHMSDADRDELLRATADMRFRYEPVVGLLMEQTASRFVNIDARGIRSNGDATPRSLDGTIWFLGGSTTLGHGVTDAETIPAQLERLAGRPVVNMGASNFGSAEETLLLNGHLRLGFRPSLALFLDGINEQCWPDLYTEEMRAIAQRAQVEYAWDPGGPARWAVERAGRKSRRLLGLQPLGLQPPGQHRLSLSCARDGRVVPLATVHQRRLAERDAICRLYGVVCQTVVQPFAGLHGRVDTHTQSFLEADAVDLRMLFTHLEPGWRAAGAVFATDALDHYDRHAFIDEIHYSADASRVIAETIARRLNLH